MRASNIMITIELTRVEKVRYYSIVEGKSTFGTQYGSGVIAGTAK